MRKILLFLPLIFLFTSLTLAQTLEPPEPFGVWSPDGRKLAVVTPEELLLYRAGRDEPIQIPANGRVENIAFSNNGLLMTTWDTSQTVTIWGALTGTRIAAWTYPPDSRGSVSGLQFADNDRMLAWNYFDLIVFYSGKVPAKLLNAAERKEAVLQNQNRSGIYLWTFASPDDPTLIPLPSSAAYSESSLMLSHDRSLAATISYGYVNRVGFPILYVYVRELETGDLVGEFGDVGYTMRALEFSPTNPRRAAILSRGGVVRFWDVLSGHEDFALTLLPERIRAIAYNADGTVIATGGIDGKVREWDTENGALLAAYPNQPADVYELTYRDGELLAFGNPLAYPHVWDAITLATISDFRGTLRPFATTTSPITTPTPDPATLGEIRPTLAPG